MRREREEDVAAADSSHNGEGCRCLERGPSNLQSLLRNGETPSSAFVPMNGDPDDAATASPLESRLVPSSRFQKWGSSPWIHRPSARERDCAAAVGALAAHVEHFAYQLVPSAGSARLPESLSTANIGS
jgi:hypothetical protein